MKLFSQNFNPKFYLENNRTEYSIRQRYRTGILNNHSQGIQVKLNKNDYQYHQSWFGDPGWLSVIFPSLQW